MANVRGWNTSPERLVKKILRRLGCKFRCNVGTILGKPDVVITGCRKLIFVNGCFWHGHRGCSRATIPGTNRKFWKRKIEGNIKRDKQILRELRKKGWSILSVWQCQTKKVSQLEKRLLKFIMG